MNFTLIAGIFLAVFLFVVIAFLASRYKRCASNQILVVYGKVAGGKSSRCLHGGAAFIWPLIQDYTYLDLTPLTINIPLKGALSQQNIRINVPSTFTVAIATDEASMNQAAIRLLGLNQEMIESMATEIILGQLRLTVASLTIEQINQDRERFLEAIRKNIATELDKIGLCLINVNVTDITDESGYIESIGKKAALTAINQAKVDVAEQDKKGAIGQAESRKEQQIQVALFEKEQQVKVAEFNKEQQVQIAELNKEQLVKTAGYSAEQEIKKAEFNKQQQIQIAQFNKDQQVQIAELNKEQEVKTAEFNKEQRIQTAEFNAKAVEGENTSRAEIATSNATLAERESEAKMRGEVAQQEAQAEIQKAKALAEQRRLEVEEVVPREIEKRKLEIDAAAQAEKQRRIAQGEADSILLIKSAEAEGIKKILDAKALGYETLIKAANSDAQSAATLLLVEKLEEIVKMQTEAIKNIKIDKITVWDSPNGDDSSTAHFMRNLVKSLPPLHDIAQQAGLDLPAFLGTVGKIPAQITNPEEKPAA
ncbi:flotillin [Spirochaetia bacterium]|nr:flotillin [Spirochaetia bacterium]